jgi:hypothetical protein
MTGFLQKVMDRLVPKPEAGNPCHEAAFDPELMPDAMRQALEKEKLQQPMKQPNKE